MTSNRSVANNTSWFTIALIIQKIITFVYFAYVAKVIGAESIGQYVFVLSFITVFALVVDIGTNHYITREVARNPNNSQNLFSNIIGFKVFSSIIAVLLGLGLALLLNYDIGVMQLLYIAFVLMIVESFVLSIYAVIRGFHNLRFEAVTTVLVHAMIFIGGFLVLQRTDDIRLLLLVLLLAHGLNVLFGIFILRANFNIKFRLKFDITFWKKILPIVLPFALAAGFSKIYGAFDQIMLSKMAAATELGFYAVAYKLTFALQFIPMALIAPLYPHLSKINQDGERSSNLFAKSFLYLLVLSLPIVAVVSIFAKDIILLFYSPEYFASIIILQLLIISLPFLFLNFPIGSLLNATDRQRVQTKNMGLALGLNIILNIILIPLYEARGAALASSISTLFLFVIGLVSIARIGSINLKLLTKPLIRLVVSVLVMTLVMRFMLVYIDVHWLIVIGISSVLYAFLLLWTKIVSISDIRQFLK